MNEWRGRARAWGFPSGLPWGSRRALPTVGPKTGRNRKRLWRATGSGSTSRTGTASTCDRFLAQGRYLGWNRNRFRFWPKKGQAGGVFPQHRLPLLACHDPPLPLDDGHRHRLDPSRIVESDHLRPASAVPPMNQSHQRQPTQSPMDLRIVHVPTAHAAQGRAQLVRVDHQSAPAGLAELAEHQPGLIVLGAQARPPIDQAPHGRPVPRRIPALTHLEPLHPILPSRRNWHTACRTVEPPNRSRNR